MFNILKIISTFQQASKPKTLVNSGLDYHNPFLLEHIARIYPGCRIYLCRISPLSLDRKTYRSSYRTFHKVRNVVGTFDVEVEDMSLCPCKYQESDHELSQ